MQMRQAFKITRRIDSSVQPWMSDDDVVDEGEVVYLYGGCTYGCISGDGIAVSRNDGETPFFEVPRDAIAPL